ncbi:MAG: transcription initiation factor IIB family protein [Candidatus Hadarchaeales archaeon]
MRCPTCGSSSVLHDQVRGEIICTRCGLVILERLLDPGPEWRLKETERSGRADVGSGSDVTLHDLGLGTTFTVPLDVAPSIRASLRRMERLQKRSRATSWRDRSLRDALVDLDKICEMMGVPKGVKTEASVLYRKIMSRGLTVGRDHVLTLSAILFLVFRSRGIPRRCEEIADVVKRGFGTKQSWGSRSIRRLANFLSRELNIRPRMIGAEEHLDRFSSQLGLTPDVITRARNFLRGMPDRMRMGKSPVLLAAVSIYLATRASDERLTLRRIADVTGVGVSTISKNISSMRSGGEVSLSLPP